MLERQRSRLIGLDAGDGNADEFGPKLWFDRPHGVGERDPASDVAGSIRRDEATGIGVENDGDDRR